MSSFPESLYEPFDLRLGRGVSQNFQPQRVSLRLILCFFSKSDGLLLFQLEIYFEPAILNGFCRLVYVGLYDGHAKVQWSNWAKVWYVICAKVLWMMGDCRSPVVKTRTQNLFTSRSGLHKWSQSINYRKKMAKD